MTIEETRKIIGKENIQYSDDEILEFIDTTKFFADIAIEEIQKMTPTERKKFLEKTKTNN